MGASRIERQSKETPLRSVIFPPFMQQEWPISRLGCDLRWKVGPLWQSAKLRSVVRCRRSSTTLPEARVAPKEGYADCLVVCERSHPLQFFECRRNHYGGEVLSTNGWNASETLTTTPSNRKGPNLLHDNARPHVAKPTLQKLNELGYETLPHPPYSPDLSPTDYHFFKHLDNFLREKCFKNLSDIKNAFSDFIATRTQDVYVTGINTLVLRWLKCVDSDSAHFDQ